MTLSYRLDWLSFSDPGLFGMDNLNLGDWTVPTADIAIPRAGYNRALKLAIGRVDWHTDNRAQKRLWTLTGEDLEALERLDFTQADLIANVTRILGVNITRLDFAADVRGVGAKPADVERAWFERRVVTQARKMRPVEEYDRKGRPQGRTVYIGSRTSENYLRVYDKGAESEQKTDWCRLELETKATMANLLAHEMQRRGIGPAGCAATSRFVDIPTLEWYTDALTGAGEADFTRARKVTDWQKWVTNVALPNVIQAINLDVPGVRDALGKALCDFDNIGTTVVH